MLVSNQTSFSLDVFPRQSPLQQESCGKKTLTPILRNKSVGKKGFEKEVLILTAYYIRYIITVLIFVQSNSTLKSQSSIVLLTKN